MAKKIIELIVPCYNEEKCIQLFCDEIEALFATKMNSFNYLITFIDDGSYDKTVETIKSVKAGTSGKLNGSIQYISFSRNFGKEAAIYAGLENSTGDYVAIMDADLQHPPEVLIDMLKAIEEEGYDCATARRVSKRDESAVRRGGSHLFYRLFCKITGLNLLPGSTDYRLMTRGVVNAIMSLPERERFTKGIYSWIGFKNKWIEYQNVERIAGTTKWSTRGLFKYAYNGFIAFATTPLRIVVYLGMFVVIGAIIAAICVFAITLRNGTTASGFSTIMISMLLLDGVIIMILGVIGEYMARIYLEVKHRPVYIVREAKMGNIDEK